MNLTNLKVVSKNVGPVIKEVAGLCGKIPNKLPSRSAVDNFYGSNIPDTFGILNFKEIQYSNYSLYRWDPQVLSYLPVIFDYWHGLNIPIY